MYHHFVVDYDQIKAEFFRIDQKNRSYEAYVEDFENKLRMIESGGHKIGETEIRDVFIAGLNRKLFGEKIVELKEKRAIDEKSYPQDYLANISHIL